MRSVSLSWTGGSQAFHLARQRLGARRMRFGPCLRRVWSWRSMDRSGRKDDVFPRSSRPPAGVVRELQSPTFAVMRVISCRSAGAVKRIIHVDAYRIEQLKEWTVLDLDEELTDGRSVLLLEWPEQVAAWVAARQGEAASSM